MGRLELRSVFIRFGSGFDFVRIATTANRSLISWIGNKCLVSAMISWPRCLFRDERRLARDWFVKARVIDRCVIGGWDVGCLCMCCSK